MYVIYYRSNQFLNSVLPIFHTNSLAIACNSLLQGTSAANLDRLERVQDVLARVVAQAVAGTMICQLN